MSKPSALPITPREYHEFYRAPRYRWWKPLAAIALFVVVWVVLSILVVIPFLAYDVTSGRFDLESASAGELAVTPMLFLANNVVLGLAIPLAGLTGWAVFAQRPKWLSSIQGGFRWRLFGRFALIAFVLLALTSGAELFLAGGFEGLAWNDDSLLLIIGILLTTPFQAAGEEYALRGILARSIGSWFGSRRAGLVVATVVTAVVFMALHLAEDPWLNSFYLLFAVVGSVLVWRTGGLEATVALHVVNNLIGEVTLPFSSLDAVFDRGAGVAGPEILWQMGTLIVVAGLMLWQARRLGLSRTAAPAGPDRSGPTLSGGVLSNSHDRMTGA